MKDEKERGRVPKMYDRGWDTTSYSFYSKLWQRRYTGCIMLKNDIQAKAYLHIPETNSRKTK